MRYLLGLLLCFTVAMGNEQFFDTEQSIFQSEHATQENNTTVSQELTEPQKEPTVEPITQVNTFIEEEIQSTNYFEAVDFEFTQEHESNIYAKFIDYPDKTYAFQRFAVKIEAIVTMYDFTHIQTRFINAQNLAIINPESPWQVGRKANTFSNLFFFKAYGANFQMPQFQIILYNNQEVVDVLYLDAQPIEYTNIALEDELFTNVIAKDLKVVSSNTKQYSNDELLTVLEIHSQYGNLEDFRLKYVDDQLLMNLEEKYPTQKLIFSATIPIYTKSIKFKYYNTKSKTFKTLVVPIKLEEELVSTQTDLNPNDSNVEFYKRIATGTAAALFLLLFLIKRRKLYLVIAIVFSLFFYMFAKPNNSIVIQEGTKIYILPTKNSTVFQITQKKQLVEILTQKGPFSKILFETSNKNKTIGWIKEKNIVED